MPKAPKKTKSNNPKPYTPANLSDWIFKCFTSPTQEMEMNVDVSGDTFSWSIPGAILSHFDRMTTQEVMGIPNKRVLINDDEVAIKEDQIVPWRGHVILLALRIHEVSELEAAKTDEGELDFAVRLKDIEHGYTSALREYRIDDATFEAGKPSDKPLLARVSLVYDDPDKEETDLFPKSLTIDRDGVRMEK